MVEPEIYNCHIHTFTTRHVPRDFLKIIFYSDSKWLKWIRWFSWVGVLLSRLISFQWIAKIVLWIGRRINPFSRYDLFERYANFFVTSAQKSQEDVFLEIEKQYPPTAKFIVLPMDMVYMQLGDIEDDLASQHDELLKLAEKYSGRIFPFFAADPRRDGVVNQVRRVLESEEKKFYGVKIYPNLGYSPTDPKLLAIYRLCVQHDVPVMTHGTYTGAWQYGLSKDQRIAFSHPRNYETILNMEELKNLHLCLAHFGGGEEWQKYLKMNEADYRIGDTRAWVKWIADMIRSGDYPNLYTDISYTIFLPRRNKEHVDFFDYLKVLLTDPRLRERVLFGSDYYVVKRENLTEREVSIGLRSCLGDQLFFQIAHTNPKAYLGLP